MKTKEVKIEIPQGYEIANEKSTLECIKFKPIQKNITYKEICDYLFKDKRTSYISNRGEIGTCTSTWSEMNKNNSTNEKQLERLLALNQLLNVAEYYNSRNRIVKSSNMYIICYSVFADEHQVCGHISNAIFGVEACFNNREDAQAVIDNPNFREILDTIYKD